jgi:hypothetical protein
VVLGKSVIGTRLILVLVASPGPSLPRRVGALAGMRAGATLPHIRACRRLSSEAERRACEIRLRAERKYGQLDTKLNPKPKSGRGKKALREETVSKYQAYEWRKLGAVPQEDFELALQQSDKPTTKGIIRATEAPSQFIS